MKRLRSLVLAASFVLGACSISRAAEAELHASDPWESLNRKIFVFNDTLDRWVLEPVAIGWDFVLPDPVQGSVDNFFRNLDMPVVFANDLLQGKVVEALRDVGRFGLNTTVGLAGFFDPATHVGLEAHDEDFGQTLAVWGVPSGPYLMLPILGPATPRDAGGLIVDYVFRITPFFVDGLILTGAGVVDRVNLRSLVLVDVENAREASVDYYVFVRNAWSQRRQALIRDRPEVTREDEEDLYFFDEE